MKFRVIGGHHYQGNPPKRYGPGDVVESNIDLATVLKNKFERVHEVVVAPAVEVKTEEEAAQEIALDDEFSPKVELSIPGYTNYVLRCVEGATVGCLVDKTTGEKMLKRKLMTQEDAAIWLTAKGKN